MMFLSHGENVRVPWKVIATYIIKTYEHYASWWFQPIWKILVKLDHFPS